MNKFNTQNEKRPWKIDIGWQWENGEGVKKSPNVASLKKRFLKWARKRCGKEKVTKIKKRTKLKHGFDSSFWTTAPLWDKTRSFWDIKNSFSYERGSEQSEQVSGASEWANGRASGPVLTSRFLFVPDHSALLPRVWGLKIIDIFRAQRWRGGGAAAARRRTKGTRKQIVEASSGDYVYYVTVLPIRWQS